MAQVQRFDNPGGPSISTIGRVIHADGLVFRDLAGDGVLHPWCDWRLDPQTRATALAKQLTDAQIAGLMLYSPHQMVPNRPGGPFRATYDGEPFDEQHHSPAQLTDQQRTFLTEDHIRHVLVVTFADVETAVAWHNDMQALAESQPGSIPINFSSDPRHGTSSMGAEFASAALSVSAWPEGLGMMATGSSDLLRAYADAVRQEYRALGITTALGPQVDLATEPRWMRAIDTFGGDVEKVIEAAKIVIDGLQTTPGAADGWGQGSVIAMVKHWPGGGTGEGGRDAHYRYGMYNVYPGDNASEHLRPFTEGAFALPGPTGRAGAVMPYYSVSVGHNEGGFGNSYSHQVIAEQLRGDHGYDGVVCTDWGITGDPGPMDSFAARCFGAEELSVAERHLLLLENGVDQFGGNSDTAPVLEAFALGRAKHGDQVWRARLERSAARLLRGIFRVGLFENPYLDLATSQQIVGRRDFVEAGRAAQHASIVRLKGDAAPITPGAKVWVPARRIESHKGFFRQVVPASTLPGLDAGVASGFAHLVDDPDEADLALVVMHSPASDPYVDDFRPISLQYDPYDAPTAREQSLGPDDGSENRSYHGHQAVVANTADLTNLRDARERMGSRPVVAVVQLNTPVVMSEVEPLADHLFVHFRVSDAALLEVLTGRARATGRLPMSQPASMETIEASAEDLFDDYQAHTDAVGNTYNVGFGLG